MKIHKKLIERIEIIGRFEESDAAFDYCEREGYHITLSGPKPSATPYVYSTTEFRFIAEREAIAAPQRRAKHRA